MYKAFVRAKSGCDKWHDYEMSVAPYETHKPIYYEYTGDYLRERLPVRLYHLRRSGPVLEGTSRIPG